MESYIFSFCLTLIMLLPADLVYIFRIIFFYKNKKNDRKQVQYYDDYLIYNNQKIYYSSIRKFIQCKVQRNYYNGLRSSNDVDLKHEISTEEQVIDYCWKLDNGKEVPCFATAEEINRMNDVNIDTRKKAILLMDTYNNYYKVVSKGLLKVNFIAVMIALIITFVVKSF